MKLKISVIGVMVLILTGTISGNDIKNALFQRLQDGSILQLSDEHVKTFDIITVSSVSECAFNCLSKECDSFTYKPSDHSCQNIHSWKDKIVRVNSKDTDEISYITVERDGAVYVGGNGTIGENARKPDDNKWIKMYSVLAGSGVSVYNSYMGIGGRSTWSLHECIQKSCSDFFRDPRIDTWASLAIDEVKLVVYKTGEPAITMTFNGRGSTKTNWFTLERLLSSPWNDLTKDTVRNFALEGSGPVRFRVDRPSWGCSSDNGWICITESYRRCDWHRADSYPYIMFSNKTSATNWNKGHGVGDSMAIFIKLI